MDVSIGYGSSLSSKYDGNVDGLFETDFGTYRLTLHHFLYILTEIVNLMSVNQDAKRGYESMFESRDYIIYKYGTDNMALNLKSTGRYYKAMFTKKKV